MGYLDSLLHVRLGAIMLMGALAGATTGLAGYCELNCRVQSSLRSE